MGTLTKRWSALLLALCLTLSLTAPALAAEETVQTAAQAAAEAAMEYGGAVSLQYAVWQEGETVLTGSTGVYSKTENRALTGDELYGIGSVSKIFTTVAVMQLVEAGRVSLDAPVTQYLKDFRMADPRYKDITVRMLLNHSSGLMGSSMESGILFNDPDRTATESLLERLSTQNLKADPGACSVYCNDGFTLAELVVEAVSGQSFPAYLAGKVYPKAGLTSVFAPGDSFDQSRLAKTYQGDDPRALPADTLGAVGAGGLFATAADLAAFGGALTGPGLLRQSSLDAMAAPEYLRGVWPADDLSVLSYGLGWDAVKWYPFSQSGIQTLVKGGDTLLSHAGLLVIPEYKLSVAVLSSGGASTYNQLAAGEIALAVLAAAGVTVDQTAPALPEAVPADMPAALLEKSGCYASSLAQYEVGLSIDGVLSLRYLNYPSIPAQTFAYHSDGTFRDASGAAALALVTEDNGETYLYQKAFSPIPGLGGMPVSSYSAVKVPENTVSPEVQAVWAEMLTASVLPMNEKYTSQIYLALSSSSLAEFPELIPGYVGAARIVDASTARFQLEIPGVDSRDGHDLTIYEQDGATWYSMGGSLYMDQSALTDLYTGNGWSYSTVQEDGYARWYAVGAAQGRTMTVQVPEDGGFWVYDENGQVTASSVLWDDASVTLPQNGLVVFAGDAGARFHLHFEA